MSDLTAFRKIEFRSRQELRDWLHANHAIADTFWLVSFKKHVTDSYIPYGEIVEELLCYGWIDSRTRRVDDDRTMLLVRPRKPGSTWSAANKKRVASLEKAGLMTEAGRKKIDAAKRDGSWSYLDDIENLVIPGDLSEALRENKVAQREFDGFNKSAKKVILLWIKTAKRSDTRAKRVSETVRLAAKGLKAAHPEARGQ
ncbi:MAG: YdeI/OmpD-associated family protein [Woeseiaceae bacterium]|nr:YdeI/OmpD-associated family protein [Woeseiaceae bacterium]